MIVSIAKVLRQHVKKIQGTLTQSRRRLGLYLIMDAWKIPSKDTCGHQKVKFASNPKAIFLIAGNKKALNI